MTENEKQEAIDSWFAHELEILDTKHQARLKEIDRWDRIRMFVLLSAIVVMVVIQMLIMFFRGGA